jgi:lipopolysaccharide/colanic/teichoic acid biosynthesis glycosyltransferase
LAMKASRYPTRHRFYRRIGKRLADGALSAVAIVALSPVLAVTALLVKATSPGPVFFLQTRPGLNGRSFNIVKFRSMTIFERSYDSQGKEFGNEQRITAVGRVLRRTSIDELPQLFNVFFGDMSIVGPRPALAYQAERYDERQRQRLDVRPGITGLAQVSGRNSLSWAEKIDLDLAYIAHLTPQLDVRIILRTAGVVVRGDGIRFEKYDPLSEHGGLLRQHVGETVGE